MNPFDLIMNNVNRSYCAMHGLPQPPDYDPPESEAEMELNRLIIDTRDDLLNELRTESLAEIIIHEHELHETDLYPKLLAANAMWDHKPETAYERMRVIDRLIYGAVDKIAEKEARRVLDL